MCAIKQGLCDESVSVCTYVHSYARNVFVLKSEIGIGLPLIVLMDYFTTPVLVETLQLSVTLSSFCLSLLFATLTTNHRTHYVASYLLPVIAEHLKDGRL